MLTYLLARLSPAQAHRLLRLARIRLADAHEWLPCPCGAYTDTEDEPPCAQPTPERAP